MKKVLACGLILSTLMSFGSVCFAGKFRIDNDSETETDYHYSAEDEDEAEEEQSEEDTKKLRKPRGDKEDKKPKRKQKKSAKQMEKEKLTNLRNQAMALLSTGLYFADNFVYYSQQEISEMRMGDLNEDCTVLTVDGESKELPACVVEALRQYLAKRAELAPNTMGDEKPLFIDCNNPKKALSLTAGGVGNSIGKYRKANRQTADMEE